MPSEELHAMQYNHNKELLGMPIFELYKTKYTDWVFVILFYCAVHLLEKKFAKHDKHYTSHINRETEIRSDRGRSR